MSRDQQFISVPVPAQYVTRVYALLAELDLREEEMSSPLPGGTQGAEPDENWPVEEWTVDNFRSLIATDLPSIQRVAAMLDLLAAEPERAYSTTALVERINLDRGQIKGALAAFTRHLHAHYGRGNWPMKFEWATDPHSTYPAEAFYRLDKVNAARWREARATA
ncbi:hypothetical protein [Streptomyces sp. Ag109_O5-10]|uniref:hypothetical protein n=1 Tax=Streptomyces sp. Ag109_O5-10 TaxID=1855349 RepID=UPI0008985B52|nr:hypothetical protein [Streptomyces sp. Ag109_O5-10]SEE98377.1 hypothetical protein SAMN05216533_4901 [Streptomyces sp. Ag109_O5-10]